MKNIKEEWDDDIIYTPLPIYKKKLGDRIANILEKKLGSELSDDLSSIFVHNFRAELKKEMESI